MAASRQQVMNWLRKLEPQAIVAIDDGGLTLVELDQSGRQTGAFFELGGIPEGVDDES